MKNLTIKKKNRMLEDPETPELIAWSSHGDLFSVSNPTAFSKTVLPQYFKHNNWQSFVRQLNMYGFHKVNDLIHSNLTNENQTWEFKHPNFRKGAVGDLQHIKRKSAKTQLQQLQQQHQQHQQQQQNTQQQQAQYNFNNNLNTNSNNNSNGDCRYSSHNNDLKSDDDSFQDNMNSNDINNSNSPVIKHILRIEEHLLGVTKSCESLFNEVVHLRMVVSKQQDAMQDLVDVVSSTTKANNNCICSNNNNNHHSMNNSNNNQELQNAENLRIQVSKLKGSQQNRKSPSTDSVSSSGSINTGKSMSTTAWSQALTASPSANDKGNNDTQQRKLPSFDSIRQQQCQSSYRLEKKEDDRQFSRKSSSGSSASTTSVQKMTNSDDKKDKNDKNNRSTMMGFGKQSHMLNPIHGKSKHRRKATYRIKHDLR
ncbi:HSF-type DNA-binding-domain-containing protein [Thamnidium elegans]|nr:HSF-type DNA-binding-domain-containing protein [Thamnidium elegans]